MDIILHYIVQPTGNQNIAGLSTRLEIKLYSLYINGVVEADGAVRVWCMEPQPLVQIRLPHPILFMSVSSRLVAQALNCFLSIENFGD